VNNEAKEIIGAFLAWLAIAAFVCVVFFFALVTAPAHASEKVMVTMFNPEVRIVLTQRQGNKKGYAKCVAQRVDKQYMLGQWRLVKETGMIHIEWDSGVDGDFTELPAKNFQSDVMPDTPEDKQGKIEGDSI
jgi:hypothetical protein